MSLETVHIWTDGACIGNPGPGGWGYVKTLNGKTYSRSGGVSSETTNIRMEMTAVIMALRSLKRLDLPVVVHTDLQLTSKGMNEWLDGWIAKGWRTGAGKPVANRDLWEELLDLRNARAAGAEITFVWVKGHSGCPQNEAADRLAEAAARDAAQKASETARDRSEASECILV